MRITYAALPPGDFLDSDRYTSPSLAAGYLAAFARSARGEKDVHTLLDPAILVGKTGEEIADYIRATTPHLVALSVYNWNREVVMVVTRSLRTADAGLPIVLGGPEVAYAPVRALQESGAWWICTGEGEIPFVTLLNLLDEGAGRHAQLVGMVSQFYSVNKVHDSMALVDPLDNIPSPYVEGFLHPRSGGTAELETMRGCPFRCNFCLYGKNYSRLRYFSLDRVRADLSSLVSSAANSIYIIDPTFNLPVERCLQTCRILSELNCQSRKKIFVEIKAEFIDESMADAFVEAGISAVEVGLQSVNPAALALMGRKFDPAAFTRGMLLLRERGIWANIGVIAGLPGDTIEDLYRTVEFVSGQALGRVLIYPLQVFPGCEFHREAEWLGLKYEPAPSYCVTETASISAIEMKQIVDSIPDLIEESNQPYLSEMSRHVLGKLRKIQDAEFGARIDPGNSLPNNVGGI